MTTKFLSKLLSSIVQSYNTKMVLVVRTDLKMEKGKIASQCAHAAVICYQQALDSSAEQQQLARQWFIQGQPKIVLKIDSELKLQELHKSALENNLNSAVVQDAGHTQVQHGTMTVLGIGPNCKTQVDKIVSHLKLY